MDTIDNADPFEFAESLYEEYEMGYGPIGVYCFYL